MTLVCAYASSGLLEMCRVWWAEPSAPPPLQKLLEGSTRVASRDLLCIREPQQWRADRYRLHQHGPWSQRTMRRVSHADPRPGRRRGRPGRQELALAEYFLLRLSGLVCLLFTAVYFLQSGRSARAGAHHQLEQHRVVPACVLPGALRHLPEQTQERLHRPRTHRTPHGLLHLRQEAQKAQQALPRVQGAHPVRRPHLRQLRGNRGHTLFSYLTVLPSRGRDRTFKYCPYHVFTLARDPISGTFKLRLPVHFLPAVHWWCTEILRKLNWFYLVL